MFRLKSIISVSLALFVLFLSTGCHSLRTESDNPALQQPSSQEPTKQESADDTKLRIGPGDPVAGHSKAALCFGCHGEDGNSTDTQSPKLSGQYGLYIAKQVRNYLASTRSHQVMSGMAASVSDEDLADISAYFASQPLMKGDRLSSNKIGKKLFENDDLSRMQVRCNGCHGVSGKGQNPGNPVYPVIGGQHKDYLLKQLIDFRRGVRNNSPGGVMNTTVNRLSDAELDALADYISGL